MASVTLDMSRDEALLLAVRLEYIHNEFKRHVSEEREYKDREFKVARYEEFAALFRRLATSIRSQVDGGESGILSDDGRLWPTSLKKLV